MFRDAHAPTGFGYIVERMGSRIYGYARVSTNRQDAALQRDALEKAGCDDIFIDEGVSGAKAHRPELDRMVGMLREGDTVVVWKLDRLGRSLQNLVELVNKFDGMGVQFRSLTEAIDTTTPGGVLVFERDLIRERTSAGLQAARARGGHGGRPTKLNERQVREVRRLYDSRTVTVGQLAAMMGVGRSTIYRVLNASKSS